ncbi:MAG: major capsid protein [Microviridae sp.]|nr:MAG: major capsid protein [Microviridae sp.]
MADIFNNVSLRKPKKNVFDLSHEKKLSCNAGELVPIYLQEIIPGDSFRVNSELMVKLAPMLAPVMHRMNVYTHYFFVPNRIIYDSWETFITGGADGKQVVGFPQLGLSDSRKGSFVPGSLTDYFGIPTINQSETVIDMHYFNALPFRAYQTIYNEYYRDQTLTPPVAVTKEEVVGSDEFYAITTLRKRSWEKDYFTSALPWAQRGGDVLLPMDSIVNYRDAALGIPQGTTGNLGFLNGELSDIQAPANQYGLDNIESIEENVTINELRKAVRLQEWLEKNARAGARYIEQIFSHFGVKSSDARLQRPEYLGGGKSPVVISEQLSSFNNEEVPGATMYGHGVSYGGKNGFKKYFEEHGFVIGIMSIIPKTAYMQGIPKIFNKIDKFDYFWPEFANIGEQEITDDELYWDPFIASSENKKTFGYTPRYAEYRFQHSSVHGDFRDSLSYWHMARMFTSKPALNANFIEADPTQRIFAVTDPTIDKYYVQLYNNVRAIRPIPKFGTPTL